VILKLFEFISFCYDVDIDYSVLWFLYVSQACSDILPLNYLLKIGTRIGVLLQYEVL